MLMLYVGDTVKLQFSISSLDITGAQQPTSVTQIPNSCILLHSHSQLSNCYTNQSVSKDITQELNKTFSCLLSDCI